MVERPVVIAVDPLGSAKETIKGKPSENEGILEQRDLLTHKTVLRNQSGEHVRVLELVNLDPLMKVPPEDGQSFGE